jgi:hypothetical protein
VLAAAAAAAAAAAEAAASGGDVEASACAPAPSEDALLIASAAAAVGKQGRAPPLRGSRGGRGAGADAAADSIVFRRRDGSSKGAAARRQVSVVEARPTRCGANDAKDDAAIGLAVALAVAWAIKEENAARLAQRKKEPRQRRECEGRVVRRKGMRRTSCCHLPRASVFLTDYLTGLLARLGDSRRTADEAGREGGVLKNALTPIDRSIETGSSGSGGGGGTRSEPFVGRPLLRRREGRGVFCLLLLLLLLLLGPGLPRPPCPFFGRRQHQPTSQSSRRRPPNERNHHRHNGPRPDPERAPHRSGRRLSTAQGRSEVSRRELTLSVAHLTRVNLRPHEFIFTRFVFFFFEGRGRGARTLGVSTGTCQQP